MASWHTPESVLAFWPGAPEDDDTVSELLDAARDQCIAYLGSRYIEGEDVQPSWRMAQAMQARTIWNSGTTSNDGSFGQGGFVVTVYSMGRDVQKLLRPPTALPGMW